MERKLIRNKLLYLAAFLGVICTFFIIHTDNVSAAELDVNNEAFYGEGSNINIYDISDSEGIPTSEQTNLIQNPGMKNDADLIANVYTYNDEEDKYTLSEIYYLPGRYTIYGGAESGDCPGTDTDISLYSGDVKTIVAGGKADFMEEGYAYVQIYGGTVDTIKPVEDGYVLSTYVYIGEDVSATAVSNISVGAAEGETGSFEAFAIYDESKQSTAQLTAGYCDELSLEDYAGECWDSIWTYSHFIEIEGETFRGLDAFSFLPHSCINNRQAVKLYGNGGTFDVNGVQKESIVTTLTVADEGSAEEDEGGTTEGNVKTIREIPVREGYTLVGWSRDSYDDTPVNEVQPEDYELYAVWVKSTATNLSGVKIRYTNVEGWTTTEDIRFNYKRIGTVTFDEPFKREGATIEGYYADGSSFSFPVTIGDDGQCEIPIRSTSPDKTKTKDYTVIIKHPTVPKVMVWTWHNEGTEDVGGSGQPVYFDEDNYCEIKLDGNVWNASSVKLEIMHLDCTTKSIDITKGESGVQDIQFDSPTLDGTGTEKYTVKIIYPTDPYVKILYTENNQDWDDVVLFDADGTANAYLPYDYDKEIGASLEITYMDGTPDTIPAISEGSYEIASSGAGGEPDRTVNVQILPASADVGCSIALYAWDGKTYIETEDYKYEDKRRIMVNSAEALAEGGTTVVIPYGTMDHVSFYANAHDDHSIIEESNDFYASGTLTKDSNGSIQKTITVKAQDGTTATYTFKLVESDGISADLNTLRFKVRDNESADEEEYYRDAYIYVDPESAETSAGADVILPYNYDDTDGILLDSVSSDEFVSIRGLENKYKMNGQNSLTAAFRVTSANGQNTKTYTLNFKRDTEGTGTGLEDLMLTYYTKDGGSKNVYLDPATAMTEEGANVLIPDDCDLTWDETYLSLQGSLLDFARSYDDDGWSNSIDVMVDCEALSAKKTLSVEHEVESANGQNKQIYRVNLFTEKCSGEHIYGSWKTVKEATYKTKGIRIRECSACHDHQYETISKRNQTDISQMTATLLKTSYIYDGNEHKPTVKIQGLVEGTDFIVTYYNNRNVGTAGVTIEGIGRYCGIIQKTFSIVSAAAPPVSDSTGTTTGSNQSAGTNVQQSVPAYIAAGNVTAAKTGGITAKVDTKTDGTAVISEISKTGKKSIAVPAKVTVNGVSYDVIAIDAKAFSKCKKVTKVTIPDSVKLIQKNAFTGAKKLKQIVFKGKKAITIKKGAFKGLNTKKMTAIFNKKMTKKEFAKAKKALKKAGFKGKVKKTGK